MWQDTSTFEVSCSCWIKITSKLLQSLRLPYRSMKTHRILQLSEESAKCWQEMQQLRMQVYKDFQNNNIGELIFSFISVITNLFLRLIVPMSQLYKSATLWLENSIKLDLPESSLLPFCMKIIQKLSNWLRKQSLSEFQSDVWTLMTYSYFNRIRNTS